MSTLRVDKIKGRTGTTVTIPDSQNLAVTGGLTVSGSQTFNAGSTLSLQGENINTGTPVSYTHLTLPTIYSV